MKKRTGTQRKMTVREKLELLKEVEARNEQRRKEFAEKEAANKNASKRE